MELVDIYDINRNKIRTGYRTDVRTHGEYLLAVHNWIINDAGEILIQKRAASKNYDPNKWGVTGGFARQDESSMDACIRETKEEVNIQLEKSDMTKLISYSLGGIHYDVWISKISEYGKEIVLQKSEVSEAAWITKQELEYMNFEKGKGNLHGVSVVCQKYYYMPLLKAVMNDQVMQRNNELICTIKQNTEVLFTNANIMLQTCDLDFVLCDMPIWKHVYHMLHSCDQWYINPHTYTEPDFHEPNLNSLDIPSEKCLSREDLLAYLEKIKEKIMSYLDGLTDDMLYDIPEGCKTNRLGLILSQFRHFYAHLGNINATTIMETNQWPRVVGITGKSGKSTEGLFE